MSYLSGLGHVFSSLRATPSAAITGVYKYKSKKYIHDDQFSDDDWSYSSSESVRPQHSSVSNYPLAQQSCGGDIGSVPYVRMYVRMFTFVIALATSFIIQFQYNFTQVLGMTISRKSSRFNVIGSKSRSQ